MNRRCELDLATLCLLFLCALTTAAFAADWPQWRGPTRDGIAPGGTTLPDRWPEGGPTKVWESEKIPTANNGGLGSASIAEGVAIVYSNWKYKDPIETRTLSDGGLRRLGWLPEPPPAELLQAIEQARLGEERAAMKDGGAVNKWADAWIKEHLSDPDLNKKYSRYARDRLRRGAGGLALHTLAKLALIKDREFANQAELDGWFVENAIDEATTKQVMPVIPTSVDKANDVTLCFDAATGAEKWRTELPGLPKGWDSSVTPCISGGRCYVMGSGGNFYCLDIKDGSIAWQAKVPGTSGSSSPLLHDGKVFVVSARLVALNAESGEKVWEQTAVRHSHTSPILRQTDGKAHLVCSSGNDLLCLDPADGTVLWKAPAGANNATPVIAGDIAVLQGQGTGVTGLRLAGEGGEKIWNVKHNDRGSSPIVYEGHAYVIGGGGDAWIRCINLESGEVAWEQKVGNTEIGSPILVGDKILAYVGNARDLYMIKATPEGYALLDKARVGGASSSSPAFANGRLYLRTTQGVACFDVGASPE